MITRGSSQPDFVGRASQLRQAEDLIRDALKGLPSVLIVEGPVGIGKTRFLAQVADAARTVGMPVISSRCTEVSGTPFRPFLDNLIPRLLIASETLPELREAQSTLESVRDGADMSTAVVVPKLVDATLWLSENSPFALVIDDVQWAAPEVLDLIDHLAYRLASDDPKGRSLVMVASAQTGLAQRDHQQAAATVWSMSRQPLSRTIALDGLSDSELVSMAQLQGLRSQQHRLGYRLARFSHGNPLVADFMISALLKRGDGQDGKYLGAEIAQMSLPAQVMAPFREVLTGLGDSCQTVLHAISLVDFAPNTALLAEVLDEPTSDVERAIDEALGEGVLAGGSSRLVFSELLFRHAARSLGRSNALPVRWAELLAERAAGGADAELHDLAGFLVAHPSTVEPAEAFRWLDLAATRAAAHGEWARASEYYETIFSVLPGLEVPLEARALAQLYEAAGLCAQHAGDDDEAIRLLQAAAAGFGDLDDALGRARTVNQLMRVSNRSPAMRDLLSRSVIVQAREGLGDADPGIAAGLEVHLIDACILEADFEAAEEVAANLADLDESVPDDTVALAELAMGTLATIRFDLEAMRSHHHAAYERSLVADDAQLILNAASFHAISLIFSGELSAANEVAEAMLRIGKTSGLPLGRDLAFALKAGTAVSLGDLTTARQAIDEAVTIELATERGNVANLLYPLAAAVAVAANDLPATIRMLDASEDRMQSYDTNWLTAQVNAVQAWSYARLGDLEVASDHLAVALAADFDRAIFFGVPDVAAAVVDAAHLCRVDANKALPAIDRALAAGQLFSGTLCLFLPRVRALARADSGDVDGAINAMESAREQAAALGAVLAEARCCIDLVRLRLRGSLLSDDVRAVELSHQVDDIVRRTGLLSLDAELRRIAAHRKLGPGGPMGQFRFVVFVDVVDSTRLTRELGNHAYLDRARRLRTVLDAIVARNGGEVQTGVLLGDGLLAVFTDAVQALEMALEASARARGAGLEVAVGIHAGDIVVENHEAHGIAVNTASRFCDVAGANEICVSSEVRNAVAELDRFEFRSGGVHEMKGLATPQHAYLLASEADQSTEPITTESELQ